MEVPQVRPGKVTSKDPSPRIVAYFFNSAQGNAAIQLFTAMGVPNDRLGVTPPERIESGQGMFLSISSPDESLIPKIEAVCKAQGANYQLQRR